MSDQKARAKADVIRDMDDKTFETLAKKVATEHRKRNGALKSDDVTNLGELSDTDFAVHKHRVFAAARRDGHRRKVEADHARLENDAERLERIAEAGQ